MERPDRDRQPFFSQPIRQITMMLLVLAAVGFGAYVAYPRVAPVFLTNPYLNGFIFIVFAIGLIACVWQVVELMRSVTWVMAFSRSGHVPEDIEPSRLLAPLATLMRSRGARMQISSSSQRSILDSVATRIDEARDITRYITQLLIFLGLLGTFYGLATTVPAIVGTIKALAPQDGDSAVDVFGRLMSGLEEQLGGMGTAFASSLLGLAGSLVIGLLELFANHGQNRFYRELEDWLSTFTRLGFAAGDGEGTGEAGVVAALADHMAEQMEALQALFARTDVGRAETDARLSSLTDAISALASQNGNDEAVDALMKISRGQDRLVDLLGRTPAEQGQVAALSRIAEGQERVIALLTQQQQQQQPARTEEPQVDAEARMRMRSIDVQLLRILEEMSAGRQESLAELRGDLAALTKAVRQIGRTEPAAPAPSQFRRG